MNIEKYKNLVETLPKESEELWFEYNLEVNKILQENQELKINCNIGNENLNFYREENKKLINQQKEFIEYMENEINKWHYNYDSYNFEYEMDEPIAEELLEEILSKYKEIIGVNNENNT